MIALVIDPLTSLNTPVNDLPADNIQEYGETAAAAAAVGK
jgi:hypothetical protein